MSVSHLYDEKIRPILRIEFATLGNDEIRNMSVLGKDSLGIELPDLYDNGEPKFGGLLDPRLGVSLQNISCATCGLDSTNCPGHFGHIELAEPVYHDGFIEWIKKILSCVCITCSKLLIRKNEEELLDISTQKMGRQRLSDVKKSTKSVQYCNHPLYGCGTPVSKIKIEKKKSTGTKQLVTELLITTVDENPEKQQASTKQVKKLIKKYLTPEMCYDILKNISNSDLILMGIDPKKTRPEDFIHKNYPFPPVAIRPSAKVDFLDSQSKEDDITLKMHEIVKANNRVRKTKELGTDSSTKYGPDAIQLLAYHIHTNFDNETAGVLKSEQKSKSTKSVSARLKGKEGRLRSNLMGKRVNFSARTVISPDPSLSMNQLRVPIKIAMNLTFPEIVTPYNIEHLTNIVKNGSDVYPGANYVIPANEDLPPIFLKYAREKVNLQYGDTVERHMIDGDITLFNRQPTLHKLSMMAHKVQVIPNWAINTFSFPLCDTKPYNADFDGDEMNTFFPQSYATSIELEEIALIDKQIISPKDSVPIIGIVQDGLLGAFNMTDPKTHIDRKSAMNIITSTNCEDFEIFMNKDLKTISGSDLFSLIIPSKVNVFGNVEIKNGKIIKGKLAGAMLAPKKSQSIIHLVYNEYGHEETRHFLDNSQKIVNAFNSWNGFTVGIGDTHVEKDVVLQINTLIETNKLEINHLITEMENNYDLVDVEIFEQSILEKLRSVAPDATKIAKAKLAPDNNFMIMISSGARGAEENIQQICALLGQQLVENKRILKKNNGRSLAYFHQNDDSARARGFVQTPFTRGIYPAEFIYHNMASREGLIDTAVKTAETGYIQRKLIKLLEDVSVKYDCTVRNSNNTVIQFTYGDNGNETTRQSIHVSKFLEMSNKEIENKIKFNNKDLDTDANNKLYSKILKLRDIIRRAKVVTSINNITFDASFMLSVNMKNIINNIRGNTTIADNDKLEVDYIINKLNDVCDYKNTKVTCMSNSPLKYKDEKLAKLTFRFALYELLSPKICINEYNINKNKFDQICENIITQFNKSIVEPGEMVGIVAAQSTGEPVTQMTLSSFHHAGIASAASLGVPRVKEIISLSRNLKTPEIRIIFEEKSNQNQALVNKIASHLSLVTMKDIRKKIDVCYDPNPLKKDGYMANDNVYNVFYSHSQSKHSCQNDVTETPWLLRIEINREAMMEKDITLLDIKSKFCNNWEKRYQDIKNLNKVEKTLLERITTVNILSNSDNDLSPVIHIRLNMPQFDFSILTSFIDVFVDSFKLKGIESINKIVSVAEEPFISFDKNDGTMLKNKHWVVYTMGVNMRDLRYINGIDLSKTLCNDIMEIYELYGIDACRCALLKEFKKVFLGAGSTVNYTHIELLCDLMTNSGMPTSIDRHAMKASEVDPLSRASFEKTVEHLLTAAVFGEVDSMKSVSSRIMAGLVIKGGTGMCDVLLDTELLQNSEYTEDFEQDYEKTFNEVSVSTIIDDTIGKEADDIFIPL
jgi:DNA-directed RNA polymerase II subunit RPB1